MYESEMLKVCEVKEKLKMLSEQTGVCKARMKSETQSYDCEIEMYVKENEKCEMFLKNVKAKCESEMQEYVKMKYKNDQFW